MKADVASPQKAASPRIETAQLATKRRFPGRSTIIACALLGTGIVSWLGWQWLPPRESDQRDPARARPAPIDGARAYGYLKQICDLGPRISGSPQNIKQRELVADHFRKLGATLREQTFSTRHPLTGKPVTMVNLIASWFPDRAERVVLLAHYDTRPRPDQERDPARRNLPFLGANDGASGVALLMEIAHHLNENATPWGVDLLLVDGEELVYDQDGRRYGEFFLGAKEFAKQYKKERRSGKADSKYVCGILLDMVAGRDQIIRREPNSVRHAGGLVRELWSVAQHIGAESFIEQMGREVLDDHLALNGEDIPTADLIDFEYPHWHLASDTPEACAPESLEEVGRVVTGWLSLPKPARKR
jgi:hypothetical protein